MNRWSPWAVLVGLVMIPMAAGQATPGPACAPTDVSRDARAFDVQAPVEVEGLNQAILVRWVPVSMEGSPDTIVGYRVWLYDEVSVRTYETSSSECRLSAVNGRLYSVQIAPVFSDGTLGARSAPVPVEPGLPNDFLYLAVGLGVVWIGVWAYAGLLVRQQRRLVRRYEALLKKPEPPDGP